MSQSAHYRCIIEHAQSFRNFPKATRKSDILTTEENSQELLFYGITKMVENYHLKKVAFLFYHNTFSYDPTKKKFPLHTAALSS